MKIVKAITMAHDLLSDKLPEASCTVDATAGNGYDTLFLAKNTPPDAVVWAFDIQTDALARTKELLTEQKLEAKLRLVHDCHGNLAGHVRQPIDVAMFNLGYLPGGAHCITTQQATTTKALGQVLNLLAVGGLVSIVAYPGHPAGNIEQQAVLNFLTNLPQNNFTVGCWQMINQKNNPPLLYIVERIRGDYDEGCTPCAN